MSSCRPLCVLQAVHAMTTAQYFAQYWSHAPVVTDLYDSIKQSRQAAAVEGSPSQGTGGFKTHWSAATVDQGLNSGSVFQVCTAWVPSNDAKVAVTDTTQMS